MTDRNETTSAPGEGAFFSRQVVGGATWAILNKSLLFFVAIGAQIVAVRCLGPERYGVFSLCRTIGETLVIFCALGLNTALLRFVPELSVEKNKTGIARLIVKTAFLQLGAVASAAILLYFTTDFFDQWFKVTFGSLLILTAAFSGARMSKTLMDDSFTALFQVRTTSVLSLAQGILWFALLATLLPIFPNVSTALWVQVISLGAIALAEAILLHRYLRSLNWKSSPYGIGKRRTLKIAAPSLVNAIANVFMRQYSELFFLGVFYSKSIVGQYDVACGMPLMLVTFLPAGIQTLFTSGFAEAYSRDKNCLDRLIATFYKVIIVLVLPVSIFGFFAGTHLVELLYGADMKGAGPIASIFFLLHTQTLISLPISMAIVMKEKVLNMQPLLLLAIAINLTLDYLLIPRYGMYGAVGAVLGTFVLTIPIRLYVVSRLVGGVYFPTAFFVRYTLVLGLLGAACYPLFPHVGRIGLGFVAAAYGVSYLFLIRVLGLLRHEDVAELRAMRFDKLNRVLAFLVRE